MAKKKSGGESGPTSINEQLDMELSGLGLAT